MDSFTACAAAVANKHGKISFWFDLLLNYIELNKCIIIYNEIDKMIKMFLNYRAEIVILAKIKISVVKFIFSWKFLVA